MQKQAWFGLSLGCALALGSTVACDGGKKSDLFNGSDASASGGSAGSSVAMGGSANPPATTCTATEQCTEQVCSADGRCVDCNGDGDCLANQHCDAEHCIANGGDVGGSGNGGGGAVGGSGGGSSTSAACNGAQVLFVVQRSGIMFEEPDGDTKYWGMVQNAVAAEDGALSAFASKLNVGAVFFVRLQHQDDETCPVLSSANPQVGALQPLKDLFDTNSAAYEKLADENAKMDAPVPEAVTAAAGMLSGNARHLVLVTTAVPDSCALADNNCTTDLAVKAVQDAQKAGVTTHVIGLGNTGALDASKDDDGYMTYLTQLANAGAGKPVKVSQAFDEDCSESHPPTATYGEQSGDAKAYRAENAADVKTAVAEILQQICP